MINIDSRIEIRTFFIKTEVFAVDTAEKHRRKLMTVWLYETAR